MNKHRPQIIKFNTICHNDTLLQTIISSAKDNKNLPDSFELQQKNSDFALCSYSSPNILIAKFIAEGTFNNAYEINVEGMKRVLRLTKTKDSKIDELIGYLMQMQLREKCPDGICEIYDFGLYKMDNGSTGAYAVLEYVPNKFTTTLEGLEFKAKLTAFNHIFSTVKCMTINGYVHSDIKEDNMQFNDEKTKVIIFDFGLSRWQDKDCVETIVGCTPSYTSPLNFMPNGACLYDDFHSVGMTMFLHFYKIPLNVLFEMINAILIDPRHQYIVEWALQARIATMILPKHDDVKLARTIQRLIIPKKLKLQQIADIAGSITLNKQAIITTERQVFTYNVPTFNEIITDLLHAEDDDNYEFKFEFDNLTSSPKFEFASDNNFNDVNFIFSRILSKPVVTSKRAIDKIRNFFGRLTLSNFKLGFKSIKNNGELLIKSSSSKPVSDNATAGGFKRRKISFIKINNVNTKRRRRHLKKLTCKRTS